MRAREERQGTLWFGFSEVLRVIDHSHKPGMNSVTCSFVHL